MDRNELSAFSLGALKVYIGKSFYEPLSDRPPRRHTHPCYELVCVDRGDEGMLFRVNPPLVEHISSSEPSERISSLLFEPPCSGDVTSILAVDAATDIDDHFGGVYRIRSLKALMLDTSPGVREHMEAELRLLFVGLARSLGVGESAKHARGISERNRLTRLEEYFNIHLADPASSKSELARELGVSERQLTRILLEVYNSNFSAILTKSRMTLAEAMLLEGDRSLDDIARAVGYYTRESFVRAYKKYYGKSPKKDIRTPNKS